MEDPETKPGTGRRDAAKAERRSRIVQAARSLIQESEDGGVSMRAIAARAEVSIATPYNLFGSKRAIIQAMLDDVREFGRDFQKVKTGSALERMFEALRLTFQYFEAEPEFYKTIWACLLDTASSPDLRSQLTPPHSDEFWVGLLSEAVKEGDLKRDIEPVRLHHELGKCFAGNMLGWVLGLIETEDLNEATSCSYAVVLSGAGTERGRKKLDRHMRPLQRAPD